MNRKLLSLPFIFWSAMFVIVPLCMVFYYGLTDKSGAFTFDNILAIATAEHSKALWEALKLSVISTVICLLLAYPLWVNMISPYPARFFRFLPCSHAIRLIASFRLSDANPIL